jgi:hypothetical protein
MSKIRNTHSIWFNNSWKEKKHTHTLSGDNKINRRVILKVILDKKERVN